MPKQVNKYNVVTILVFLLFSLLCLATICIREAFAFRCYICDSKDDIECTENLPANSRLISQDCANITGAKYCIKTTNIYAGEFGTKRFCAANDHGNYCKYIRQPTGNRDYRSCVLTCDSENCNGSGGLFDGSSILYVTATITILSTFLILVTTI
uniref:Uncharacterized protein n=1 Tax=Aceria tosichella TaxID=561515 RepID=A0A6G1S6Z8_9ACAR